MTLIFPGYGVICRWGLESECAVKPVIDHNKNEFQKVPDHDGRWIRDKFGPNPTPKDLIKFLWLPAVLAIGIFAFRLLSGQPY